LEATFVVVNQRFPKWVPRNPRVPWTYLKGPTSYTFQCYAKTADMFFNPLGVWQPLYRLMQLSFFPVLRASCWIVYALWLLLLCIILFTVQNLNYGNLIEKSVYIYLAVLEGVPCPPKMNLQYSADKKVWEPLCKRSIMHEMHHHTENKSWRQI